MTAGNQISAGGAEYYLELRDNLTRNVKRAVDGAVHTVREGRAAIDGHIKAIGRGIEATGARMAKIGAGATAFGAGAAFGLARATIAAGDFAETLNMFEAVFKDQSKDVERWAQVYGKNVKRSKSQLMAFAAEAQDTFVPLGFERGQAAELSKTLTKLSIDLASFKNLSDRDAFDSLIGGVVGITTNLRKFGVIAQEAQIKQKALQLGFDPQSLTPYQKALAILEITIDGTKDAQGDAIRTAGSFANSVKGLKAAVGDLARAIGGPLLDYATALVRGLTGIVQTINQLLTRFPVLTKVIAAGVLSVAALGATVTVAGLVIKSFGTAVVTAGLALLVTGLRANGLKGSLALATGAAGKTSTAIKALSGALGANAKAWRGGTAAATAFRGSLGAIVEAAGAISKAIGSAFTRGGFTTAIFIAKKAISGFVSLLRRAFGLLNRSVVGLFRIVSKLGVAIASPWVAVTAVIATAAGAVLIYYKNLQKLAGIKSAGLDQERLELLQQSYRDAGQEPPTDFFKKIDFNNARVRQTEPEPQAQPLSEAQADLAQEINAIRTPIEIFRKNMAAAAELLDRGEIDSKQFDRYQRDQREQFRNEDPATQRRDALAEQLRTPLETFRRSIAEARAVFATDPEMFRRAVEAAREQFRANDQAAQLARNLETPAEAFRRAIAEARKVFADSPAMMRRAFKAAREQFKQASPLEQLKASLQTPAERFAERLREIREILATAPAALRDDLSKKAAARARDEFKQSDPAQRFAANIRDSLTSGAKEIATKMAKARELLKKGLITKDQAGQFGASLLKTALGSAPDVQSLTSFGTSSAMVAANIGAFAPTFDGDREMLEWQKKKAKLQAEIKAELQQIRLKRTTFF